MRILATITKPKSGNITFSGIDLPQDPNRFREVLGYVPQDFVIYPNLNAAEFLEYLAAVKGLDRRSASQRIDEFLIAVIRRGRLLLDAMPEEWLQEVEGMVWEWITPSKDLPSVKQRYAVGGKVRHRDGVEVRIISASSPDGNARLTPRLEHAYLHLIAENGEGRTP